MLFLWLSLNPTWVIAKGYSSGGFDVEHVGFLVPGPLIDHRVEWVGFEDEGSVFVEHAEHTGAAGSTVEPPVDRVVIGVFLGLEEDVMVAAGVEFEESWVKENVPEYQVWL